MPLFRCAALIDNPDSGQPSPRREAAIQEALDALRAVGVEVRHLVIDGAGSGSALAREAVAAGCDAIVVCGGDGTVHEVLQALVGTNAALGVLPMGTANALASDLGMPRSPRRAMQTLLASRAVPVPVGRVIFHDAAGGERARYFTVAAGVGADALLMARMDPALKRRLGYVLYLIEAFRIWVSHPFPLFRATFVHSDPAERTVEASQLLAVRVRSFGGALGRLAPGATLHAHRLYMLVFKTRSRMSYLRFLLAVVAGRQTFRRDIELVAADAVDVRAGRSVRPVYVEADGEVLGQLPVHIEVAQETLTLLIPPGAQP